MLLAEMSYAGTLEVQTNSPEAIREDARAESRRRLRGRKGVLRSLSREQLRKLAEDDSEVAAGTIPVSAD